MDLKALIAKSRAEVADSEPGVATVLLGGELVDIAFGRVAGHVWADLCATCPPRPGAKTDAAVGFNYDAVARKYPLDAVLIGGEPLVDGKGGFDTATWGEIIDVLPSPSISAIATVLYAINQNAPAQRIAELGKARMSAPSKKRTTPTK